MSDGTPDGIHLIPLPLDDRRTVNATLIEGRPLTLVDTGLGYPASLAALRAGLAARGHRLADIEQIVITHAHLDHFGAATAIVRESGAQVIGDAGGAAEMADFLAHFERSQVYRQALYRAAGAPEALLQSSGRWGRHYATLGEAVRPDAVVSEGDSVTMGGARWQVIDVPGHAATSIALYDSARGLLLSGDILVSIGAANVTLHQVGDGRLPAGWQVTIMAALDRLAALPLLRRVYPGHGDRIDDPRATLAERQRRTEGRLTQVLALLRERPRTAYEVSLALYQPPVGGSSLGLSQSLGYVDALEMRGQAIAIEADGVRRYRATP